MPSIRIVSGPSVYLILLGIAALATAGIWFATQPMLEPLGAAKYALIPVYFVASLLFVVPAAAAIFIFGAIILSQISAFAAVGLRKPAPAEKPKPMEYMEYDEETRGYVKKTGYF